MKKREGRTNRYPPREGVSPVPSCQLPLTRGMASNSRSGHSQIESVKGGRVGQQTNAPDAFMNPGGSTAESVRHLVG